MTSYECDKCGACCSGSLIVEAYELDLLREPKLAEVDLSAAKMPIAELMADLDQDGYCILIACGKPCKLLGPDNECSVYPTRPNACVVMQAGDEQCQAARESQDLPPLMPKRDSIGEADKLSENSSNVI